MWVEKHPSSGSVGVFNGVNGVLHIKYADRGTKRKKIAPIGGGGREMALRSERNVWGNVCKLDAVIDYRLLSLTARHMETVTVFRYEYVRGRRTLLSRNAHQFLRPVLFDLLLSPLSFLLFFNFLPPHRICLEYYFPRGIVVTNETCGLQIIQIKFYEN